MPSPIGLAADGTSRIFIKLSKDPNVSTPISSIKATIYPTGNNLPPSITGFLGKVLYAPAVTYNPAANNSGDITDTKTFATSSNATEFYFCLFAPDDFTMDPTDQRSERDIEVDFDITYSNSNHELLNTKNIKIVR